MNVAAARPADVPLRHVAAALGLDRSAFYPRPPTASPTPALAAGQPRALSAVERQQTLDLLHSERFCDQAPRQVHATCLSEGLLVASWSTMYRLLRAGGESQERRGIRPPQRHAVPQLIATAPNQVWTWDITKLPTLVRGVFLCLYVILDLYSRQVVGWMVSRRENAGLAKHLFGRVLSARSIAPDQLIVHQDRGAPMTALCFTDLLESLGVERSYSRPRVSNDNAFSESQFKTLKYAADYPERFEGPEHARQWLTGFFDHYHQRPHEGLALYAPSDLYEGRVDAIHTIRQATLDAHFRKHPERYINGPPKAKRPPASVAINPRDGLNTDTAANLLQRPGAFTASTTSTEETEPTVMT